MAAVGGEDFMSIEIVINKCCVCLKKNKRTEATTYCGDCKDYYCTSCVDIHTAVPSMEHHKLLDKSDFKSTRSGAGYLPCFPTQRCDEHKSEVLNMYCKDHDEVACVTCIGLIHRSCKNVMSIPENIDILCKISEMSNTERSIELTRTQIEEIKKSKEAQKQLLTISLDTAVDSVKSFKQELQTLLDDIERDTILEIKKQFDRIEKSLAEEIKIAENQIDALNVMDTHLRTLEVNKVQEFVCVKTFEKLAKKCETEMNEKQRQSYETISFAADQSIKSFLQKLKVFGKVTCQLSSVPNTRLAVKSQQNTPIATLPKTTLYKVTKQREVRIKLAEGENYSGICGSCIIDDGFLLLADNSNSKLKRLNLATETVTDYLSLISRPNAVCEVSKTEAAVSLHNNTVQFVLMGDQMSATRTLTFNHYCNGLAHHNGKLFISARDYSVYIYDTNGKELKKITFRASGIIDTFLGLIFGACRHIAVSADGNRVFVAAFRKGLITLDIQGNNLSTLSERETQASGCYDVCTDGSNVFVCGYLSNNVVQIGQDHKRIGEIARISSPLSVSFDSQKKRLYVTNSGNVISVLELVYTCVQIPIVLKSQSKLYETWV